MVGRHHQLCWNEITIPQSNIKLRKYYPTSGIVLFLLFDMGFHSIFLFILMYYGIMLHYILWNDGFCDYVLKVTM